MLTCTPCTTDQRGLAPGVFPSLACLRERGVRGCYHGISVGLNDETISLPRTSSKTHGMEDQRPSRMVATMSISRTRPVTFRFAHRYLNIPVIGAFARWPSYHLRNATVVYLVASLPLCLSSRASLIYLGNAHTSSLAILPPSLVVSSADRSAPPPSVVNNPVLDALKSANQFAA